MNFELYDGSTRCAEDMDASVYADETDAPCTYCGFAPHTIGELGD